MSSSLPKCLARIHNAISDAKEGNYLPLKIVVTPKAYEELLAQEKYFDKENSKLFGVPVEVDKYCNQTTVMFTKDRTYSW